MYNYNSLKQRSERHYLEAHIRENKTFIKDLACIICHPPKEISEKFYKFWDWYGKEISVTTYSEYTVKIFQELLNQDINEKDQTQTKLLHLIGSIRYSTEPELTIPEIAIKILERIVCSKGFELSIEQTEQNIELSYERTEDTEKNNTTEQKYTEQIETEQTENYDEIETERENIYDELKQPEINIYEEIERTLKYWEKDINTGLENLSEEKSDSEESKETTELINNEDLELESLSETESELSEYNLEQLFEEPEVNMAGIT